MYDLLVIGAGPGGYSAAIKAAKNGKKTAIVEASSLGGTCLNTGCITTKYLVSEMHAYKKLINSINNGMYTGNIALNYDVIKEKIAKKVDALSGGINLLLSRSGVDVYEGHAEFVDSVSVRIIETNELIKSKEIIIATGALPRILPTNKMEEPKSKCIFTTDDLFSELNHIPESITIVGAGAVGLELSFIYSGFGSFVTIIEQQESLLGGIDSDIEVEIIKMLKTNGIKLHLNCSIDSIFYDQKGVTVFDENEEIISSSEILIFAVGRVPNTKSLNCKKAGIELLDNKIKVDEYMRTSTENIYAIGDVNGLSCFAYAAMAQAENVISNICGDKKHKKTDILPVCIFADTEIAYVGLGEKEAIKEGINIKKAKFLMSANGRSKIDENGGFIKIIVEKGSEIILGAVCICNNASELITYIAYAINNKQTIEDFTSVIFPHPTYSESLSEAVALVNNNSIHMIQ